MKLAFVSRHLPEEAGSAAGRQLWSVGEALVAAGHEVTAWSWRPEPPTAGVPSWCTWQPLPATSAWRTRGRALVQPRSDAARGGWVAPADAVAVADDPVSWAAVAGQGRLSVATVHYAVSLDSKALADRRLAVVQDRRGERRALRGADVLWALSDRVRVAVGRGVVVPACVPLAEQLPLVDDPVVGLLADWSWPPNLTAARTLLDVWPQVRADVPGARLVLAGRGASPVGRSTSGVEWLGEVPVTPDLLAQVAVFAFPCPATSGPKMKVLDALAHGVPVLTTAAGAEGLAGDAHRALVVADGADFHRRLVELLRDPQSRAGLATAGRRLVERGHAPAVAAQARLASVRQLLSGATGPG